jgi:amino acid adenylation domain-containing protein
MDVNAQSLPVQNAGSPENLDQQISAVPHLANEEWQQIVVDWNDTAVSYPLDRCAHQLFEDQVERTPHAVAVVYEERQLTYQELNRRANQLAHYLRRLGVGPEVLVGLCVERSPDMIVGVLGILKAGGAYVPLDPAYPPDRLAFMLADSRAPVLLTQKRFNIWKAADGMQVVNLDEDLEQIRQESEENPASDGVMATHAAYIIYTSGSTGTPKGVVVEHRSLVNYMHAASAAYALEPADRVLQFAPLSFDASAEEIYPCLARGATLVLRTPSMIDSIPLFLKKCQEWKLTVLGLPTAFWHELTRKLVADALSLPPSLRLVIIGGERALPELVASWQKHVGPAVQLVNTYGPTEATIVATMYRVPAAAKPAETLREVPIGRPIPNARVYILDQHLNVVPIGVPGELHIGGAGLARGYLNRSELTEEKFIPNPYSTEPGARLYKTGDLVRYLPTGEIEFLGRIDQQVKIRGFRIELGEVEAALGKHPHVREALVLAREDASGNKSLVAYVVPAGDFALTSSSLRRFMLEQLPGYMVPAAFVILEAFPLTPSGKIDRLALPAPELTRPELAESYAAPTSPVQQQLVEIWEELLEVRPIGIRDNFFELGGHSLLAVRLVDRIEQVWGKKIAASTLLAGPTIERLSEVLTQPEPPLSKEQEAGDANGSRRTASKRSFWSGLIGKRHQ